MQKLFFIITLILINSISWAHAPVNQIEISKYLEAAQEGNIDRVKQLADQVGLDVQGEQKMTAMMQAILNGQEVIVDYLLGKKSNLEIKNENGDTAIAVAVGNDRMAIAEKLYRAGAKVDVSCGTNDETLLMCATRNKALQVIKLILRKSPTEIDKKNSQGKTAFDIAKELSFAEALATLQPKVTATSVPTAIAPAAALQAPTAQPTPTASPAK